MYFKPHATASAMEARAIRTHATITIVACVLSMSSLDATAVLAVTSTGGTVGALLLGVDGAVLIAGVCDAVGPADTAVCVVDGDGDEGANAHSVVTQ